MVSFLIFLLLFFNSFLSVLSQTTDTIEPTRSFRDGDSIISAERKYELVFFNPGRSTNRYVGIRYGSIGGGTVVWVANRETPLNNSSGVLILSLQGTLTIEDGNGTAIWSSNLTRSFRNPVAQLLDSGNLVIRERDDRNPSNYLWQSFDHMGNTLLPGMKSGKNLVTGAENYLTSWKSEDDPSIGDYSNRLDPNGVPQFFNRRGSEDQFRSGPWNGLRFSGMPNLRPNSLYTFEFVFNEREIFYRYNLTNGSVVTRFELTTTGPMQRFTWLERTREWQLYLRAAMDDCDRYALCGPHGSCNINNSPPCGCLRGFVPREPDAWAASDWNDGCVRRVLLECREGEDFVRINSIKVPDTRRSWYNRTMNLEECRTACLGNCSCTAYANLDIRDGGSGCIHWFGELTDIREYAENGQDIFIRLAASEIAAMRSSRGIRRALKITIPLCVGIVLLGIILSALFVRRRRQLREREIIEEQPEEEHYTNDGEADDLELPLFDIVTLIEATNKFSAKNKLGQGGFGPVYKGVLKDGLEIAVKRLSKKSRQGLHEFKNEVKCIAKLQHRNLVRLLGCCIQAEERMLVYEYMPNRSLDAFIFHTKQSMLLDWPKRLHIINGIARGLLYLHQDSRLRIIHRDLKASNVLLDFDMNPKISDFGMARSFGGDETEANTNRVVGTYGYMSPEYAIDGLFSIKSDVFSFGVLVLEIVSGKRNRGFTHADHKLNLLGHAWKLFNGERSMDLIDEALEDTFNMPEVLRSIHVALLCVQQSPEDRPNMSTVVLMLTSEIALPPPKKPGFYAERNLVDAETSSGNQLDNSATNEVTITLLQAR